MLVNSKVTLTIAVTNLEKAKSEWFKDSDGNIVSVLQV